MYTSKHLQRFCASPMQAQLFATSQFLIPTQHRNFGAGEKILQMRMKSVNSIRKITKAMKMVATAKMKGDLVRMSKGKDFAHGSVDMIFKSDTYLQRRQPEAPQNPRELLVAITSDKGLCGSINSGVMRDVRAYVKDRTRANM